MTLGRQPLDVVVLSCGSAGIELATRLSEMREMGRVLLATAPYTRSQRPPLKKLRRLLKYEGPPGVARALGRRLPLFGTQRVVTDDVATTAGTLPPHVRHVHVADFHHDACLNALREFAPTLGVVAGTYILRPSVFEIPALGMINLHCGKAPQYRGASPAFWELYNGEREVGITIHWVESALDAGNIVRQETFPLDSAPPEDPMRYIETYRRDVLAPNGVRLVLEAVGEIAQRGHVGAPQDSASAATYPMPDYRTVRELRRRVRDRRRQARV